MMEMAALSSDPRMQNGAKFWATKNPTERRSLPLEAVAELVGMSPGEFLGEIVRTAFNANLDIGRLMTLIATPKVVQKTIEYAMHKDGHRERDALFKHIGFVPVPQGSRTSIHVTANAQAAAAPAAGNFESRVLAAADVTRDVLRELEPCTIPE